jgi:tripartite-type tricarboxylate transporter receptor subunit TctC
VSRRHLAAGRRLVLAATGTLALTAAMPALAQTGPFPNRPVKLVVPFPPGGPVDTVARAVGQKLQELWGQPVVVENRAGAGGQVGADFVAKAPADGYTVFVCSIHHTVLPALKPKLPYDIQQDFVPLTFGARFPIVLVLAPGVEAKTVAELIALAKKSPGKLAYASSGNGGGTHLAGELFDLQAGTKLLHVPYKGSAPAVTDLIGGQTHILIDAGSVLLPHVKSGRLKALAVTGPRRDGNIPDVPTVREQGLPGMEASGWQGLVGPAGLPREVVERLSAALRKTLAEADVKARFLGGGAEVNPRGPQEFAAYVKAESERWASLITQRGVKLD